MSATSPSRVWVMRLVFAGIALLVLFINLLPLDTTAPQLWAGMDLLMLFAMAWSVRRPEYVPVLLLAVIFLLADLLLQRPPGLWAFLCLLACENLKNRALTLRDFGLAAECLTVCAFITGIYVANRVILAILIVDAPPIGLYAVQFVSTLLAYPVVLFVTHTVLGVRKAAPGDLRGSGLVT